MCDRRVSSRSVGRSVGRVGRSSRSIGWLAGWLAGAAAFAAERQRGEMERETVRCMEYHRPCFSLFPFSLSKRAARSRERTGKNAKSSVCRVRRLGAEHEGGESSRVELGVEKPGAASGEERWSTTLEDDSVPTAIPR